MNDRSAPRLSIGLPVYNGDNFLEQALDSILAQTFVDFELIISDNASTDQTETICRAYAARDPRIRYIRNPENLGASANFNQVFTLSVGKYFKWIAHDDLHKLEFLEQCIQILDQDPSVVLAYSRAITINQNGKQVRKAWGAGAELSSVVPHQRFRESLSPLKQPIPLPIFGVIRASILRNTHLMAGYPDCDCALLAELSLYGRFYEISESLFLQREHNHRAGPRLSSNPYWAATFWDSRKTGKIVYPHWRLFARHLSAINKAPLNWSERLRCHIELMEWLKPHWQQLLQDLMFAGEHLPAIGSPLAIANKKYLEASWVNNLRCAVKDIDSLIPRESTIILVDGASFGTETFGGRRTLPFLEREGQYWGPPPDDETAIQELVRMRQSGASFFVVGWPVFWWLDYYSGLHDYLSSNFRCILHNSRLVVFDLQP
jgi:glycosyltransferase involved in cell wall biosynthesis